MRICVVLLHMLNFLRFYSSGNSRRSFTNSDLMLSFLVLVFTMQFSMSSDLQSFSLLHSAILLRAIEMNFSELQSPVATKTLLHSHLSFFYDRFSNCSFQKLYESSVRQLR